MRLNLLPILENGQIDIQINSDNLINDICHSTSEMYKVNGFNPPWIGYLVSIDSQIVGTCAFKSPPKNGKVEIAYFTFSEYENKGIGTEMAKQLISIAKSQVPTIKILAQTMPEENVSTKILKKLNFKKIGVVNHPEDGEVWEWEAE